MKVTSSKKTQKISIPWGAWFADTRLELELPTQWQLTIFELPLKPALTPDQMETKLSECFLLIERKKPGTIVIVVDDLTRPVYLGDLLERLLQGLHQIGVPKQAIRFLIGLGMHRPLSKDDMAKKLGKKIVDEYVCLNHNPEETEPIGQVWGKTEVRLNRHYLKADFRIVISGLTPHSFAGFSGGAKMLIPGLADAEIVTKTHKSVMMGFMGKLGEVENNRFRKTIESLIAPVRPDFFIGVVLNWNRTIVDIFTGDYIQAHREASISGRRLYETALNPQETFDVVILNAYPKDTELLQAENSFIPIKSFGVGLVKEGGTVVLTSACSEGMGVHGLFEPGGRLYRSPRPLHFLKNRNLLFYSPNVTEDEFHRLYWAEYRFFNNKKNLINYLKRTLPKKAKVGVFPYSSLQLLRVKANPQSEVEV